MVYNSTKNSLEVSKSAISTSGEFSLTNLKDVPSEFQFSISDEFGDSLNISDPELKVASSYFFIYDNSDTYYAYLQYEGYITTSSIYFWGEYYYSNKAGTVTGSFVEQGITYNYDITLSKGWNIIYGSMDYMNNKINYSSQKPADGSWVYYSKKSDVTVLRPLSNNVFFFLKFERPN